MTKPLFASKWFKDVPAAELRQEIQNLYREIAALKGELASSTPDIGIEDVDGLQDALDGKVLKSGDAMTGPLTIEGFPVATILESGPWTPTLLGSTTNPTVTYSSVGGYYMRVDKLVWINARLQVATISGGSGGLSIGNLPVTVGASTPNRTGLLVATSRVTWPTVGLQPASSIFGAAVAGDTRVSIVAYASDGTFPSVDVTGVANDAIIYMSGFYWTD